MSQNSEKRIYKVAIYEMRIDRKPGQADRRIQMHTQYEQIFDGDQIKINALIRELNDKAIVYGDESKVVPSPAEVGAQIL